MNKLEAVTPAKHRRISNKCGGVICGKNLVLGVTQDTVERSRFALGGRVMPCVWLIQQKSDMTA